MLILECGKREVQNAFRKQWKKYLSVSVYGKRKTENGIGKKTVSQTVKYASSSANNTATQQHTKIHTQNNNNTAAVVFDF